MPGDCCLFVQILDVYYMDEAFAEWRRKSRVEARFVRLLNLMRRKGDGDRLKMSRRLLATNLFGGSLAALERLRAWLAEGEEYDIWIYDEEGAFVEIVFQDWVTVGARRPSGRRASDAEYADDRPPSKQPDAVREERQRNRNRARLRSEQSAQTQAGEASAFGSSPDVGSETASNASDTVPTPAPIPPANVPAAPSEASDTVQHFLAVGRETTPLVGNQGAHVGSADTALELASLALLLYTEAEASLASLTRAGVTIAAPSHPNNRMVPSEDALRDLLRQGWTDAELRAAIPLAQKSAAGKGGVGDWKGYLGKKLPDVRRTLRAESSARSSPAPRPSAPPARPPEPPPSAEEVKRRLATGMAREEERKRQARAQTGKE